MPYPYVTFGSQINQALAPLVERRLRAAEETNRRDYEERAGLRRERREEQTGLERERRAEEAKQRELSFKASLDEIRDARIQQENKERDNFIVQKMMASGISENRAWAFVATGGAIKPEAASLAAPPVASLAAPPAGTGRKPTIEKRKPTQYVRLPGGKLLTKAQVVKNLNDAYDAEDETAAMYWENVLDTWPIEQVGGEAATDAVDDLFREADIK